MSGFSPDWLGLRESVDGLSRSRELAGFVADHYPAIVDLGAGTGANLRWLAPQLGAGQQWLLVDNDPVLLAHADRLLGHWARNQGYRWDIAGDRRHITGTDFDCAIEYRRLDLNARLADLPVPQDCLVTASALLDLVSDTWLSGLIDRVVSARASVLWALSYDGKIAIAPAIAADDRIRELVNRHQLGDKGFGPALGPDAWIRARQYLERAGYRVRAANSDWQCTGNQSALADALLAGWAEAAAEICPEDLELIRSWKIARARRPITDALSITVGHRDLAARPQRAD